jgi:hypothetical protein
VRLDLELVTVRLTDLAKDPGRLIIEKLSFIDFPFPNIINPSPGSHKKSLVFLLQEASTYIVSPTKYALLSNSKQLVIFFLQELNKTINNI